MTTALQVAGATAEPSSFAPLHINRFTTGLWSNSNPLRDAASALYEEKFYGGRNDRLVDGLNCEISSKLTLRRRAGLTVYNKNVFPAVKRFYSWNTFDLTNEYIKVLADTKNTVYDVTGANDGTGNGANTVVWNKAAGAGDTYFLGVGNTLYFTNGKENMQIGSGSATAYPWGIDAPVNAPLVSQSAKPNPYDQWAAGTVFCPIGPNALLLLDTNNNIQTATGMGTTGAAEPSPWETRPFYSTVDGSVTWQNVGPSAWQASHAYVNTDVCVGLSADGTTYFFEAQGSGNSAAATPIWASGMGALVADGTVTWKNKGAVRHWADIGPTIPIKATNGGAILDTKTGYVFAPYYSGVTGATIPTSFQTPKGAITPDNKMVWISLGPFSAAATGPVYYGYEHMNDTTNDLSNMSPKSQPIVVSLGAQVTVQGDGTGQAGVNKIVIFKTLQGGSTFGETVIINNPGAGNTWTWVDTVSDADVNLEWQAQISGEGTPLPIGATCLEYHNGHIFAAVGNVVYVSSGPDATVGGSSGNAGFDTTFTAQSKIIRFWVNSLGVAVFTVRDVYLIAGDGTDSNPFNMQKWITNLPLLNYDAFDVNLTTPYLVTGNRTVMALDPSAGIIEMSFPIADIVAAGFDPKLSSLTYHTAMTGEAAWFLSDGSQNWYRLSPINAPDSGFNWNPKAQVSGGYSALQSVEIAPGVKALLVGPASGGGPIRQRDATVKTDTGTPFAAYAVVGSIILAQPGQLAGLAWITIESMKAGTPPTVSLLLNEITGTYENIPRTHQDPPNLPPSVSIIANRHSVLQGQRPVWCRHLRMRLDWPAEDAANELLTYTVFGQIWQELRSA